MAAGIGIERLRELIAASAQLVEVLPEPEYVEEHLPGAINLPLKRLDADSAASLALVVDDVVTCGADARIGDVRPRVAGSRYSFAFVVSPGHVLLGRLRRAALEGRADAIAESVMEPGPSTIRADAEPAALAERMRARKLTSLPVTTPEGRLLGVVRLDDLEADLGR